MIDLITFIRNDVYGHRAAEMAMNAHENQLYGGHPYFEKHVMGVASRVARAGFPEEYVLVALLHDVIEDSDLYTMQDIANEFSPAVVAGVQQMTKSDDVSYMNYLIGMDSEMAFVVKIADMMENLSNNPSAKNKMKYEMGLDYLAHVYPQTYSRFQENQSEVHCSK